MSSTSSIGFSAGGIDVSSIVTGLMDVERAPLRAMQTRQATAKSQATAIDSLRSELDALRAQALAVNGSGFGKLASSSSLPGVALATLQSGASTGSLTFTVDRLATAHALRSAIAAGAPTDQITTAAKLAVSNSTAALGIASVRADAATAVGTSTLTVTQGSGAATRTGSAVTVPAVVDATSDTLTFEVNGVARVVSLGHGTYTAAGLAVAVQAALDAAGGGVRVALQTNGSLRLSTSREGSAASLQMTGGNALAGLGFSVDATAALGTDAVVDVNGVTTTITDVAAGGTATVANGSGSFTLQLSGGLRTGTAKVATVATGSGSLSDVAAAINGASVGVSATVTQVAGGTYYLQLGSSTTGAAGTIGVDASQFLGGLVENSAASDASITVGDGPGAYVVTATGNEFRNLMGGTTITALQASTTKVTVSVRRDDAATADAVGRLIDQANAVLKKVNDLTKFDASTKVSGVLAGNAAVRGATTRIRTAVTDLIDTSMLPADVGISSRRDGTLAFDRAAFLTALAADPAKVNKIFSRNGTSTGPVTFVDAAESTAPGAHTVNVVSLATKATATGPSFAALTAGQQLAVRRGSTTAIYTVPTGATSGTVVAGMQAALTAAGLDIDVADSGGTLSLTARTWGGSGNFELNPDLANGPWSSVIGADVVGTIDGILGTGDGTRLRVPTTAASDTRGLVVDVGAGATIGTTTVDYKPGIAARLGQVLGRLADATGALSSNSYTDRVKSLQTQMDRFQSRMSDKEVALRRQWSVIQSTLESLQAQGSWLANQVSSLSSK